MPTTMPVHHIRTDTFGVGVSSCPPTYGAAGSGGSVFTSGSSWCSYSSPNTSSGITYFINDLLPRSIQSVSVLWAFPPGYTSTTCDWTADIYEGSTLLSSTSLLLTSMSTYGSPIYFTPSGSAITLKLHPTTSTSSILIQSITYDSITYTPSTAFATICDDDQYRYGFNGQMKSNEMAGLGNWNTALFWEYGTREARRKNLDPRPTRWASSYSVFFNNPVRFCDPLGDTIKIQYHSGFLGLGRMRELIYENGKLYNLNGTNYDGKVNAFLKLSVNALNTLSSKPTGRQLINDLQASKITTHIAFGSNRYKQARQTVFWDPSVMSSGLDLNNNTYRPAYIGLGHELSHAWDFAADQYIDYGTWYTASGGEAIPNAELFSTHFENKIRAEHGISLRQYYSILVTSAGILVGEGQILSPNTRQNANTINVNGIMLTNPKY